MECQTCALTITPKSRDQWHGSQRAYSPVGTITSSQIVSSQSTVPAVKPNEIVPDSSFYLTPAADSLRQHRQHMARDKGVGVIHTAYPRDMTHTHTHTSLF